MATIQTDKSQEQTGANAQQSKGDSNVKKNDNKDHPSTDPDPDDDRKLGAKHVNHPSPSAKQGQGSGSNKDDQHATLKDDEDVDENSSEVK